MATSMEYNTVQKLREVPLMTTKGQVITLQDIANVTTASKDASSISVTTDRTMSASALRTKVVPVR